MSRRSVGSVGASNLNKIHLSLNIRHQALVVGMSFFH